ncbi:hypothetical protein [Microvirga vignae]|nr:hypothetical protein [Microvirga vignae]
MVEQILSGIENGGGAIHLRDLASLLVEMIGAFERDPGLEAATDDLYAAAERLVRDRHVGVQPLVRKLRLLSDAHARFRHRMEGMADRVEQREQRGNCEPISLKAA